MGQGPDGLSPALQQQAAYAAWSAECIARLGLSHPWGVIEATFEPDALKLGRLQAAICTSVSPTGRLSTRIMLTICHRFWRWRVNQMRW